MVRSGKTLNWLFGISVLSWGFLGIVFVNETHPLTTVRITISAIHFVVGVLLIFRAPIRKHARWASVIGSLPGFLIGGFALTLTPAPEDWPIYAQLVFGFGGVLVIMSLFTLGKNFSIFPALRAITQMGLYRFIRHPAYAGELMLIAACCFAAPVALTLLLMAGAIGAVALRILVEEQFLLQATTQYESYSIQVRWRLIPYIW